MNVTTNILQRTFYIRYAGDSGTCFTADVDDKRYLVTARHIVQGIGNSDHVDIMHNAKWVSIPVRLVGHGQGDVDISVLAPSLLFGAPHPLSFTAAGLTVSEDVYFLGFPFGLTADSAELNSRLPFPLVKRAIVSAIDAPNGLILLDGHNNPGFSGGPVVRSSRVAADPPIVIGVVSGYKRTQQRVLDLSGAKGPYTYDTNTGIVVAHYSKFLIDIARANPIGIDSSPPSTQ